MLVGWAYWAATRLDLADCRTRSGLVAGLDGEPVVTVCSVIVSCPAEAGWTADVIVATTPLADIRKARTTYPVTTDPPLLVGGFQWAVAVTVPPAVPEAAVAMTGAPGTVAGVTTVDRAEFGPVPILRQSRNAP